MNNIPSVLHWSQRYWKDLKKKLLFWLLLNISRHIIEIKLGSHAVVVVLAIHKHGIIKEVFVVSESSSSSTHLTTEGSSPLAIFWPFLVKHILKSNAWQSEILIKLRIKKNKLKWQWNVFVSVDWFPIPS